MLPESNIPVVFCCHTSDYYCSFNAGTDLLIVGHVGRTHGTALKWEAKKPPWTRWMSA